MKVFTNEICNAFFIKKISSQIESQILDIDTNIYSYSNLDNFVKKKNMFFKEMVFDNIQNNEIYI